MDAIGMLKEDHRTVEQLFKRFEKAGDRAHVERRRIVDRIVEELSGHAAIEEQVFYPVVRATVPGAEDMVLESVEEHHIVKWVLSELDSLPADDERFDAKVTVLIENVRHHVEEEEQDLFPKVREELGRQALDDMADAMALVEKGAPTHPHPRAPDSPPANLVAGAAAGVADRIGDTVSGLAQGGVSAVGDIISAVLHRDRPRVSPTGSKVARATATKVRSDASDAADSVIEATRRARDAGEATVRKVRRGGAAAARGAERTAGEAGRGATKTARAAAAGAKGTATSARKSTKQTTTTAKRGATTTAHTARKAATRTASTAKRSAGTTAAASRGAKRSS